MSAFVNISEQLSVLIEKWESKLQSLDETTITERFNEQNRSIRQIVGHMVDSASNNTHRVIHLQYRDSPVDFPDYANLGNNDRWISIQNYQHENWQNLVQLWKYTNLHFAYVIEHVSNDKLENEWVSALNQIFTDKVS